MHACMGMKIEEWDDGQVNIGIAVCPTRKNAYTPTRTIAAPSSTNLEGQNTPPSLFTKRNTTCKHIVPKSAFVIRPPEHYQSQGGGINITYAYNESGNSDLIIMLNPEDQGQRDKISFIQQKIQQQFSSEEGIKINSEEKSMEEEKHEHDKASTTSAKNKVEETQEIVPAISETDIEEVKGNNFVNTSGEQSEEQERENLESNSISGDTTSGNHTSPQEALNKTEEEEENEQDEMGKALLPEDEGSERIQKKSGSMKRVSWVEDCEKLVEGNISATPRSRNSKENKSESVRKSYGGGNSNRSSPMKVHQNGYHSPPDDAASVEGFAMAAAAAGGGGKRRSGDKSRIPIIPSNGDYQMSCDYYRRKMLRECMCNNNPTNLADNWYGYTSLQKYAGQKVVKKIAEEQKRLEEDISNRRKTEIWILGNDMDDYLVTSPAVPLRKRTTRLKPMHFVQ